MFITTNNFLYLSDWVIMTNNYPIKGFKFKKIVAKDVKEGDIIFVKSDMVYDLVNIIDEIKSKFILITGNSDVIVDKSIYFSSDKIIRWYSTNSVVDCIENIPIGLQNENLYFNKNPQNDQSILNNIIHKNVPKTHDVLMSFNVNTNKKHRQPIYDHFKNKNYVTVRDYNNSDRWVVDFMLDYYADIKRHRFVICPLGNGPDCHRYWETLYLGGIPIIQKHKALDAFFSGNRLPVLYIDNIMNIDKKLLDMEYNKIKNRMYDMSIIYMNFWVKKIKNEYKRF